MRRCRKIKGLVFDAATSARSIDSNGYMHVDLTPISKACVNPYLGEEIPGWQEQGLIPDRIYYVLRDPEELQKAAPTFNGLPLLLDHHEIDAEVQPKEYIVGSTGTDATFDGRYLKNSLSITDEKAIKAVEDGSAKEISCSYSYTPDWTSGEYEDNGDKIHYDLIMRDIQGNHVALVAEGRAGHDVKVADGKPDKFKEDKNLAKKKTIDSIIGELLPDVDEQVKNDLIEQLAGLEDTPADDNDPTAPVTAEPTGDDEPEKPINGDDDLEEKMKDPAFKAAFELGVKYGTTKAQADDDDVTDPAQDDDVTEPAKDDEVTEPAKDDEPVPALTGDSIKRIKDRAKDEAKKEVMNHFRAMNKAAISVRPLVGEIKDVCAFDSASDIYAFALKQAGKDPSKYPKDAYKAMVDILLEQPRSRVGDSNFTVGDSFDKEMDDVFSRLDRIG